MSGCHRPQRLFKARHSILSPAFRSICGTCERRREPFVKTGRFEEVIITKDERLRWRDTAHRPLGSVMRARLQMYQALFAVRSRESGVVKENTADITAIPA